MSTSTLRGPYYTPITVKIPFNEFKYYKTRQSQIYTNIDDALATLLSSIDNNITSSNIYIARQSKQPIQTTQNRLTEFRKQKDSISKIQLIMNSLVRSNIDEQVEESIKHSNFDITDIKMIADMFLGMCTTNIDNINIYMSYFTKLTQCKKWYARDANNAIISFKDQLLNQLEEQYNKFIKLAIQNEQKYIAERDISDDNVGTYLRRKNCMINMFKLICAFYNNKILSTSVIIDIFNTLQENHLKYVNETSIYLELWLIVWQSVSTNLQSQSDTNDYHYNGMILWLNNQLSTITDKRIQIISHDIINSHINTSSQTITQTVINSANLSFYDVDNEMKGLTTIEEFTDFYRNNTNKFELYVTKYLLEQIIDNPTSLLTTIPFVRSIYGNDNFTKLINNLLVNDDVICDFPVFISNINTYL